jgi:hypothetical protein
VNDKKTSLRKKKNEKEKVWPNLKMSLATPVSVAESKKDYNFILKNLLAGGKLN